MELIGAGLPSTSVCSKSSQSMEAMFLEEPESRGRFPRGPQAWQLASDTRIPW